MKLPRTDTNIQTVLDFICDPKVNICKIQNFIEHN